MSTPPDSYYENLHSRPLLIAAGSEPKNSIVKKILLDDPATANWVPQKNGEPTMNTRAEHAALLNALKLASQCNSISEVVTRTLPEGEHSAHFHQGFYAQVRKVINGPEPEKGALPNDINGPSMAFHREAYLYGIECAKAAGFDDVMQEVCNAQTLPRDMRMPE